MRVELIVTVGKMRHLLSEAFDGEAIVAPEATTR
jgi:hypothetical protein